MFIFKKYIAVQHFWVGKIKKKVFKVCNAQYVKAAFIW